jgi:hypothetical protein
MKTVKVHKTKLTNSHVSLVLGLSYIKYWTTIYLVFVTSWINPNLDLFIMLTPWIPNHLQSRKKQKLTKPKKKLWYAQIKNRNEKQWIWNLDTKRAKTWYDKLFWSKICNEFSKKMICVPYLALGRRLVHIRVWKSNDIFLQPLELNGP